MTQNSPKMIYILSTYQLAIANCKQGSLDVGDFYNKLSTLWNELNDHVKRYQSTPAKGVNVEQARNFFECTKWIRHISFLWGWMMMNFHIYEVHYLLKNRYLSLTRFLMWWCKRRTIDELWFSEIAMSRPRKHLLWMSSEQHIGAWRGQLLRDYWISSQGISQGGGHGHGKCD